MNRRAAMSTIARAALAVTALLTLAAPAAAADFTLAIPTTVSHLDPRVRSLYALCQVWFDPGFVDSALVTATQNVTNGAFSGTINVTMTNATDNRKSGRYRCWLNILPNVGRDLTLEVGPGGGDNIHQMKPGMVRILEGTFPAAQ